MKKLRQALSACRKSHILLRGRPLVQGVPSPKTVHRTVFEFTPCGAFSGYMWGFAPHPTRAVSPWPDQRDVIPLETRCLSFRLDSNFFDRLRADDIRPYNFVLTSAVFFEKYNIRHVMPFSTKFQQQYNPNFLPHCGWEVFHMVLKRVWSFSRNCWKVGGKGGKLRRIQFFTWGKSWKLCG